MIYESKLSHRLCIYLSSLHVEVFYNSTYRALLQDIVGEEIIDELERVNMADYSEFFREFEMKKRKKSNLDEKIILKVPFELGEMFQAKHGKTLQDHLVDMPEYKSNISWAKGKLILAPEIANTLYRNACVSAAYHLKLLFQEKEVKDVPTILMVGGFSACFVLQDEVKKALPLKQVIVPRVPIEPADAVLTGAVIFGHAPCVIRERRCRYTYGTRTRDIFKEGVDPEGKKIFNEKGVARCDDRFSVHIRVGEVVPSGRSTVTKTYFVAHTKQTKITFNIFASDKKDPYFVTEPDCIKVGSVSVDISGSGLDRSATLCFIFGDTEITAEVIEEKSGKKTKANIKFLG